MIRSLQVSSDNVSYSPDAPYFKEDRVLPFRRALAIGILIALGYFTALLILRSSPEKALIFSDLISPLINALAVLCLFYAAKHTYQQGGQSSQIYKAWLVMGIGQLLFAIGDVLWAYVELVLQQDTIASPSDIPYLLYYPIFLWGVLLLPGMKFTSKERQKMLLDTGIILIVAILIFWSLIITPTLEQSSGADGLTAFISIAYPVMDLVLVFAVIELLFKRSCLSRQAPFLLASGLMVMIVADAVYMRQNLEGTYVAGSLMDNGWMLGYILIGLAGISQSNFAYSGVGRTADKLTPCYGQLTWPLYLPYISAALAFALLIWSRNHIVGLSFNALSFAVAGIIGMVIARQIISLKENDQLISEVMRLNEHLEQRVFERTSQLEEVNRDLVPFQSEWDLE